MVKPVDAQRQKCLWLTACSYPWAFRFFHEMHSPAELVVRVCKREAFSTLSTSGAHALWPVITEEEQRELQTIIGIDEKYRRKNEAKNKRRYGKDEDGLTEKQRERLERNKRILTLHEQGVSNREIGRRTGIAESTVRYVLSKVRNF